MIIRLDAMIGMNHSLPLHCFLFIKLDYISNNPLINDGTMFLLMPIRPASSVKILSKAGRQWLSTVGNRW